MSEPATLSPILQRNLAFLGAQDPVLAERITWPCASDHVAWTEEGAAYRIHRTWHPLSLPPDQAAELPGLGDPGGKTDVLLCGVGLGEQIDALLAVVPKARILAWDQDPWLLRHALSRRDWTPAMRRGQLRFLLTSDLVAVARAGRPLRVVQHPLLGDVYRIERALLDAPPSRVALLAASGLFADDVAGALRGEGIAPFPWDLRRLSREELVRVAQELAPELVVAVNMTHGLAELCADLGIPLRVWEIDPSTDELPPVVGGPQGAASRGAAIFTFRRSHVAAYARAGFARVAHLPLATDPARRHPVPLEGPDLDRYGALVTFVGSSLVEQGLAFRGQLLDGYAGWAGGDPEAAMEMAEEAIQRVLDAQRDDFSTYRVPELLAAELPEFVQAFEEDEAVYATLGGASPAALLAEMAAADKRITYVANLGQVGIKVWGDAGWEHVQTYGAEHMGPAGHRDELTAIYSNDGIHVDIGRLYQDDIVTMRVFDVLACGGFCLAEWSEDLEALFVIGEELDCYRTLEELLEKVSIWLEAGPEARRAVGEAGRQRVLRDHTMAGRIKTILAG